MKAYNIIERVQGFGPWQFIPRGHYLSDEQGGDNMSREIKSNTPEGEITETIYPVMEIFDSIQGEGSMIGMPVTFIRLAGCNLKCPWCDTKDSWAVGPEVQWMTSQEVIEKIERSIVVITGGEPCMHDLKPLVSAIREMEEDILICVETNGTLPSPDVDWVVCSPKPPEYKIHGECFFSELKYVVDEKFNLDCIPEEQKEMCGSVWLQPEASNLVESRKRCYELAMETKYLRVGLQLHKIMEVE